ncbi:unnamed protein product, partial [Polarella glacialis]
VELPWGRRMDQPRADSFDSWAASLCWADEAFPAAPSSASSLPSTVAAPYAEIEAARAAQPAVLCTQDILDHEDDKNNKKKKKNNNMQDILHHEASADCGPAWLWSAQEASSSAALQSLAAE